jgi:hypothetical protein
MSRHGLKKCKHCEGERVWEGDGADVRYAICTDCGDITGVHDTYTKMMHRPPREEFKPEPPATSDFYKPGMGYPKGKRKLK